ncbi:hypothetical protein [Spirosoma areae]
MNKTNIGVCGLLLVGLLTSVQSFGQYYPGGSMSGRRMGGMGGDPTMSNSQRASVPNIAGALAQKETKWLKENLSLTKDQLKAVKNLNNDYGDQQQDAIKDILGTGGGRPSPEAVKQVQDMMLMLNEEKEDKLKPILTPEQWALYQSKKDVMTKEIGGWRPPAPKKDSLSKAGNQP